MAEPASKAGGTASPQPIQVMCEVTGEKIECKSTTKGNPKLPRGWKWIGGKAISAAAMHESYFLGAVTCDVVSPDVNGNQEEIRAAWKVLNEQLTEAWRKSTEAANWAAKRLWSNDVTRQASDGKCPKMPEIYLYGERDWTGWASSAAAVLRTIQAAYVKKRYEIVWTGSAGVPFVRYPYPYPVHNATWNLQQLDGGSIVFEARLPSGRVSMRLRTKDKAGKFTMVRLRHLIANPDLRGEAAILKRKDGTIQVKLVGYFPKTKRELSGELRVRTGTNCLLTLFNEKDERLLILNGDWIKSKIDGHDRMLQRWREDQKFEIRRNRRKSQKSAEDMQNAAAKQHSRLKSFIDQTCAQIVGHAIRRQLSKVRYDDVEKGYFLSFPWFRFTERLAQVCHREGLEFERFGAEEKPVTARKGGKTKESSS